MRRRARREYIGRYKHIAVAHAGTLRHSGQHHALAQGILESDCGNGALSRSSNNHFGIRYKATGRDGASSHDDDARGECFRAYGSVEASYGIMPVFWIRSRAATRSSSTPPTTTASLGAWLKAAGYATAPDYAQPAVPHHPRRSSACSTAHAEAKRSTAARNRSRRAGRGRLRGRKRRSDAHETKADRSRRFPRDDQRLQGIQHLCHQRRSSSSPRRAARSNRSQRPSASRRGTCCAKFSDLKARRSPCAASRSTSTASETQEGSARHHRHRGGETVASVAQAMRCAKVAAQTPTDSKRAPRCAAARTTRIR